MACFPLAFTNNCHFFSHYRKCMGNVLRWWHNRRVLHVSAVLLAVKWVYLFPSQHDSIFNISFVRYNLPVYVRWLCVCVRACYVYMYVVCTLYINISALLDWGRGENVHPSVACSLALLSFSHCAHDYGRIKNTLCFNFVHVWPSRVFFI